MVSRHLFTIVLLGFRADFKPAKGKYTLLDMGDDDEEDAAVSVSEAAR